MPKNVATDQYTSPKIIELKDLDEEKLDLLERKSTKQSRARIQQIEEEMIPLKQFLTEAHSQRNAVKAEICMKHFVFLRLT